MDEVVVIEVPLQPITIAVPNPVPVVVEVKEQPISIEIPQSAPICITLGVPGPAGPPGFVDPVFIIKPNATLSYDMGGLLIRIDYADGTFKDLSYTNGLLTEVQGQNLAGDTITKTLTYTNGLLTGVATVVT